MCPWYIANLSVCRRFDVSHRQARADQQLKARPRLNGQSGLVKFFAEDWGRYAVFVNGEQMALKPENVTLASITLADESPPASAMVLHSSVDILMTIFGNVGVSPSLPCVCSWWRWTFNVWMREMVLLSPEFTIGGTTIGVARLTEFARPTTSSSRAPTRTDSIL